MRAILRATDPASNGQWTSFGERFELPELTDPLVGSRPVRPARVLSEPTGPTDEGGPGAAERIRRGLATPAAADPGDLPDDPATDEVSRSSLLRLVRAPEVFGVPGIAPDSLPPLPPRSTRASSAPSPAPGLPQSRAEASRAEASRVPSGVSRQFARIDDEMSTHLYDPMSWDEADPCSLVNEEPARSAVVVPRAEAPVPPKAALAAKLARAETAALAERAARAEEAARADKAALAAKAASAAKAALADKAAKAALAVQAAASAKAALAARNALAAAPPVHPQPAQKRAQARKGHLHLVHSSRSDEDLRGVVASPLPAPPRPRTAEIQLPSLRPAAAVPEWYDPECNVTNVIMDPLRIHAQRAARAARASFWMRIALEMSAWAAGFVGTFVVGGAATLAAVGVAVAVG